MTDESRPRPRYGEYATPQDQAKAMGLPHPPAPAADSASSVLPPLLPAGQDEQESSAGVTGRSERASRFNRLVTVALLAFGLLNVLASTPGYLQLPKTLQTVYDQLGIGTYSATALASTLGIVAVVAQSLLWLATAAVSVRLLRRGRLAWWVPLVGGVLCTIVLMAIMYFAMFNDPALAAYLGSVAKPPLGA